MGMGLRIVDLLPALPEPNQRWLVLLGPLSVDQATQPSHRHQ